MKPCSTPLRFLTFSRVGFKPATSCSFISLSTWIRCCTLVLLLSGLPPAEVLHRRGNGKVPWVGSCWEMVSVSVFTWTTASKPNSCELELNFVSKSLLVQTQTQGKMSPWSWDVQVLHDSTYDGGNTWSYLTTVPVALFHIAPLGHIYCHHGQISLLCQLFFILPPCGYTSWLFQLCSFEWRQLPSWATLAIKNNVKIC